MHINEKRSDVSGDQEEVVVRTIFYFVDQIGAFGNIKKCLFRKVIEVEINKLNNVARFRFYVCSNRV